MRLCLSRITALLLALAALAGSPSAWANAELERALLRTEAAFQGATIHGDAAFLVTQAARKRGKQVQLKLPPSLLERRHEFPFSLEYWLWQLRDRRFPLVPFQMPAPGKLEFDVRLATSLDDEAMAARRLNQQAQSVFAMMANVMQCRPPRQVVTLVGYPGYEYVATHQVLALVFAVSEKCLPLSDASAVFAEYAGRVRDEFQHGLARGALTDLQVERAAVLCFIRQCALVPKSFVSQLLKAQRKEGIWQFSDPASRGWPVEHTTALAYFVLAHVEP